MFTLARTTGITINNSDTRYFVLLLTLMEIFSSLNMILGFVSVCLYRYVCIPTHIKDINIHHCIKSFYYEWMLNHIECLFEVYRNDRIDPLMCWI